MPGVRRAGRACRAGFTFIELLVTITIIAIVFGMGMTISGRKGDLEHERDDLALQPGETHCAQRGKSAERSGLRGRLARSQAGNLLKRERSIRGIRSGVSSPHRGVESSIGFNLRCAPAAAGHMRTQDSILSLIELR